MNDTTRPALEGRPRLALAGVTLLAALLLFANLGNRYLWQDEAQTALVSRTILDHGVPHGHDGRNSFSQELGVEYGEDGIWKWHTWLSFYLVAGSFALFGADTLPSRLPFALFALATVVLTWFTARDLWRDRSAALATALLLTLSVPFLVMSRQCRYYAVATLLSLLGLHAYARLAPGARRAPWVLFAAAFLLFHTHYVYAATLLATLLLHALLFERARLRTTFLVSLSVTALAAPWIAWVSTISLTPEKTRRFLDLRDTPLHIWHYGRLLFSVLFGYGAFLAIPALLAVRRWRRGEALFEVEAATRSNVALLVLYCLTSIVLLSVLSPLYYVRYLAPLLPPLFLLAGLWVGSLWHAWRPAAVAAVIAFAALGSLREFAFEITHDYDGPVEGIVKYLRGNAGPDDLVAIVYGDLPVKFYTDLRVLGGLTGEDLEPAREADWIILRQHLVAPVNREVRDTLRGYLSAETHERHLLSYPDTAFENREDPALHRFRTVHGVRPVVIWERRRRDRAGPSIEAPVAPR